ncbi:S8 family peptidase [Chitinophaga sp. 22321]|uniref:S8 family peptidase n=1 Tax=Chitinophaga hostae TaxID=2831022 RepID=A0ABS5IWV9_9BACT|nr:S8 family peptidase [Chitinophaga hostae]MBS0027453.1 S8 family peptidase [Chitinophaga hostae]
MKLRTLQIWPLLTLMLCYSYTAIGQQKISTDSILYRYAADTFSNGHRQPPFLVKFRKAPSSSALRRWGMLQSLTRYHYVLEQLPADSNVVYCYTSNSNYKAAPDLLQQVESARNNDSISVQAACVAHQQPAYARIQKYVNRFTVVIAKVRKEDWQAFISQPAVIFANSIRRPSPEIIINTSNLTANRITIAQQQFPLVRGKRITVSVKEDLFDTTDIDLRGRYVASSYTSAQNSSHASVMATLIGGAGNSGEKGLGAAPEVKLSSADYNSSLFPDEDAYYTQSGITVQNHSYGTGIENYYGAEAVAYDQHIQEADTIVHVYSSGNIGNTTSTAGRYQGLAGYANLSGNFKQAKNVIVAGGTDGTSKIITLSSRGPAYDGRIKPEIAAYGEDGTSGAAAITSGVAALLQDAWRQQHNTLPSSALIKAVIINSAIRPSGVQPSYDHGYGYLHALGALQTLQENRVLSGEISAGKEVSFDINVPAGMAQAKITLCWNDPAAGVNAVKALVNDLDLTVVTADNNTWLPWVLSTYPAADSLAAMAQRGRDSINNTEQISIQRPAAGKLRIHVKGRQLATALQRFHLAYEFTPLQRFQWQYPAAGNILEAAQNAALQWQTTYSGNGDISYSRDSGKTWISIAQNVPLEQGLYNWVTPNIFEKVQFKLTLPDTAFTSTPAYISPVLTMQVGFNCQDTVLLYWNSQPGAAAYQLYTMGSSTLIPYSQLRDTFVFIPKATAASLYFAVSAIAPAGWTGIRSYAIDYTQQGTGCYVQSLLADKTTDNKVLLSLSLGSNWHLSKLFWERWSAQGWTTLSEQQMGQALNLNFLDEHPPEGLPRYRVRIETVDGTAIYSDIASVSIFLNNTILLFPNPVSTQLYILDAQARSRRMVITDMSGRIMMQRNLEDGQEIVPVQQLPNGVFNCSIYVDSQRIFSKQFVKQ